MRGQPIPQRIPPLTWRKPAFLWTPIALALAIGWPVALFYDDATPQRLLISALFAAIHMQYDWFGVLQVFFIGLLFGFARWRSGSTLLTILMHVLANLWATVETMIKVEWLS